MKEVWKTIKGYENSYEISSRGRVKSLLRKVYNSGAKGLGVITIKEKILKQGIDTRGYFFVVLYKKGEPFSTPVHRIVAETFIKGRKAGLVVDHIDRNPRNNRVDNLRWVTQSANRRNSSVCINSTSIYNGVCWSKEKQKWEVKVRNGKKMVYIGRYNVEYNAALAFNTYVIFNHLDKELNTLK